jgi:quinol monooxygenase YgiN
MVATDGRTSIGSHVQDVRKGGACRFQASGTLIQEKEDVVTTQDTQCTVTAFFTVKSGKMDAFEKLADRFVEKTRNESGMLAYGWSFNADEVHCRQRYLNAEGFLEHVENVFTLFQEALTISDCTRLAIHGPEDELAKLREPMAQVPILQYFELRNSFRK